MGDLLQMGVRPTSDLAGLDPKEFATDNKHAIDPASEILPGDVIVAVNDKAVTPKDYPVFDQAIQNSGGKPVRLRSLTARSPTVLVVLRGFPGYQ